MAIPFYGGYSKNELKPCYDKVCLLCNHKGLIAHISHINPFTRTADGAMYIDSYWCPNCNISLVPSETGGNPV